MRALRAPDGCPWDREQTLASLRPFVLEETYEVLEAIEGGSPAALREELGDYLYEAVFLAQITEESGEFSIADAIDAICDKLVRRHPHVFARQRGDDSITSSEVIERWETMKARERAAEGRDPVRPKTTLSGVPKTLPALLRAYEISARAAAVGFDWARAEDVLDKIEEEVAEVRQRGRVGRDRTSVASGGGNGRSALRHREPFAQAGHRAGGCTPPGQREVHGTLRRARAGVRRTRPFAAGCDAGRRWRMNGSGSKPHHEDTKILRHSTLVSSYLRFLRTRGSQNYPA